MSVCKDCDIPIFPSAGSTAQNCRPCSVCPDGSTVGKICTETEDTLCVANGKYCAVRLNPSLAEHDMPCLSKQCRSRSVGF